MELVFKDRFVRVKYLLLKILKINFNQPINFFKSDLFQKAFWLKFFVTLKLIEYHF